MATDFKPGEVAVDLGCGAGIDVILAAHKVGPRGRVVGVDLSSNMIEKAKMAVDQAGLEDHDIELVVNDIEQMTLDDGFADVVISNATMCMVPHKDVAYAEAYRILKPGGRLAITDLVFAEGTDHEAVTRLRSSWQGGLGGAISQEKYIEIVRKAGFGQVEIISSRTPYFSNERDIDFSLSKVVSIIDRSSEFDKEGPISG